MNDNLPLNNLNRLQVVNAMGADAEILFLGKAEKTRVPVPLWTGDSAPTVRALSHAIVIHSADINITDRSLTIENLEKLMGVIKFAADRFDPHDDQPEHELNLYNQATARGAAIMVELNKRGKPL